MSDAEFVLKSILPLIVFIGFFVACWWIPHTGHRLMGRLGLAAGSVVMSVFPIVLVVVALQVWTGMNACVQAELESGIWTDKCDSAADVFVFFIGFVLAPLALLVTGRTAQRRWKFSSWKYPLKPKMSHGL